MLSRLPPSTFSPSKLASFRRQLNLYGFIRLTQGLDSGAYYHELFLRGKPSLCHNMVRIKIKGTGIKAASSPEQEPNFYALPPVVSDLDVTGSFNIDSCISGDHSLTCEQQQKQPMTVPPVHDCESDTAIDALLLEPRADDQEMLEEFCSDWDVTTKSHADRDFDARLDFPLSDDWMLSLMVEDFLND
jgi:HSF-type DNA-binding